MRLDCPHTTRCTRPGWSELQTSGGFIAIMDRFRPNSRLSTFRQTPRLMVFMSTTSLYPSCLAAAKEAAVILLSQGIKEI